MLQDLGWERLQETRKASRLIVLHKIPKIRRTKHLSAQFWNTLTLVTVSGTVHCQEHQQNWGCVAKGGALGGQLPSTDLGQCQWNVRPTEVVPTGTGDWMHADEGHAASSRSSSSTVEKWWSTPPGSQFLAHPQDQPVQLMLRPICFLPAGHSTGRNNSSPEPWLSGRPSHCWQFNQPWWRPSKTQSKPPSLPVLPPPPATPSPHPTSPPSHTPSHL